MRRKLMKKSPVDKSVLSDYWTNYIYHPKGNMRELDSDFDALSYMDRLITRRESILHPKKPFSRSETVFRVFLAETINKLNHRRLALTYDLFPKISEQIPIKRIR